MEDMPLPVSGPQPGSDQTVSTQPADGSQSARRQVQRVARDRRRSLPSPAAEAELRNADERTLIELRRKVQDGELLSASAERLLWKMRFNGHLTVVVQNGRVLKSGYEEGYFRRRNDLRGVLLDV